MKRLLPVLSFALLLPAQERTATITTARATERIAVPITGGTLQCDVLGSGPPLLLLSGGPGFGNYLRPVADALAEDHRCILLDQRGTGSSKLERIDDKTVTVDLMVADLEAVRSHLKLERWSLFGHSWGGMLAMAYACKHGDRVDQLVLVAPGGPDLGFVEPFTDSLAGRATPEERKTIAHWTEPEIVAKDPVFADAERRKARFPAYFYDRDKAAAEGPEFAAVPFSLAVSRSVVADLRRIPFDVRSGLAKVKCPTLIVHGRQDAMPESVGYQIRTAMPHAELRFVERCGHFPWLEQPQALLAMLRPFLKAR